MMANLTTVHLQRQRSPVALANYFDAAYMLAKEEMPFTKYPAIVELEKRHGVSLGNAHLSDGDQLAMLDVFPLRGIDLLRCPPLRWGSTGDA
ncbi:hypothetical protein EMCRGX_G028396 [Ephydatia muelleri]